MPEQQSSSFKTPAKSLTETLIFTSPVTYLNNQFSLTHSNDRELNTETLANSSECTVINKKAMLSQR